MQRYLNTARLAFIVVITAIILLIYSAQLYALQVYDDGVDDEIANATTQYRTLKASRGDLLDRNGVLLTGSVTSYNVILSREDLMGLGDGYNDALLDYINTANEFGVEYNDSLPITLASPFNYVAEMTDSQRSRLDTYFEFFGLDENISASDLVAWLKNHYKISYSVPLSEARLIMGVRYELECRAIIMSLDPYVFVETASAEFISVLYERGYPGFTVERDVERKYYTDYAAHFLGYIGQMNGEQYETYKEYNYPMDAMVGQSGMELAFEEYLHGVDGREKLTIGESGAVLNTETITEVRPGYNVYSSIDIELQGVAEDAMDRIIHELNLTRDEGDEVDGAAVAAVEVNTGEVLVCATYPNYSMEEYWTNYDELAADPRSPFLNRATSGIYNPGSTFKPVMAYAGLKSGKIDTETTVYDSGRYTDYIDDGYAPYCWIYGSTGGGHGSLNVVGALENSCNYFFWWIGDNIGLDAITAAAAEFGLGEKTGAEIEESTGYAPTAEIKKNATGLPWYAADTLLASIGQGYNMYTPLQLANYTATIANGGTRYGLTFLHSIKSADYTRVLKEASPVVASELTNPEYLVPIKQGMEAVATSGTASGEFNSVPVRVACKTGTVQSDDDVSNTGVFICYAPAEKPEIAVSVVIQKGTSGATVLAVAREVLESYFSRELGEVELIFNNSLVQ